MSSFDWDLVDCPEFVFDDAGAADAGLLASSAGAVRAAANLLRQGLSKAEVAAATELDQEEVAQVARTSLLAFASPTAKEHAASLEEHLSSMPEAFLCSRSRELMAEPALDWQGLSFDRSQAQGACHPNPYLKREIEAFRTGRARAILASAPDLAFNGFPEAASRILSLAAGLCRGLEGGLDLRAEVLELAVQLPSADSQPRLELVKLLAEQGRFSELVSRFDELRVGELCGQLSCDFAAELYDAAWLQDSKVGGTVLSQRLAVGRALVARLSLAEEVEIGKDFSSPKRALLLELYALDPAADLCEQLAASCVQTLPLGHLWNSFAGLPSQVLEAAVAHAKAGGCASAARAAATLVMAAERFGRPVAAGLYRHALELDPECSPARQGLIHLLLRDLGAGEATTAAKAELARALVAHGALDDLASHFDALQPWVKLRELCASDMQELATELATLGKHKHAAETALAAAEALEASDAEEALHWYTKALQWDSSNVLAKDGMKRLSIVLGQEWQAVACLLTSIKGHDAVDTADLAKLMRAAVDKAMKTFQAEPHTKAAHLEQDHIHGAKSGESAGAATKKLKPSPAASSRRKLWAGRIAKGVPALR